MGLLINKFDFKINIFFYLMKVHCYNYREHLSEIQNILCQALNYPVALHIVKYLVLNYLT